MQPRISVRNGKLSEETKEHVFKACNKLEQFFDRIVDCEVIIEKPEKEKLGHGVEFVVKVPHQTLAASATGDNLYKALADAQEKVEVQLKKYHDKLVAHR